MPQRLSIFTLNSTTIYNLYFMFRKIVFCITLLMFDIWDLGWFVSGICKRNSFITYPLHALSANWLLAAAVYILNPSHWNCIDPTLTYRIIKPCLPNRSIRHFIHLTLSPFACPLVHQRWHYCNPGIRIQASYTEYYTIYIFFPICHCFSHPFSQLLLFIIQNSICKVV